MKFNEAIKKRINELIVDNKITVTDWCKKAGVNPNELFSFMTNKVTYPQIDLIAKLCIGVKITLVEFFDRQYFKETEF